MATYTTIAKVEAYTLQDIASGFESNVTVWITGVSALMDTLTNRKLEADGSDSIKYYDGNGKEFVSIDDLQTITTVELGDHWGENFTAVTNYVKYPAVAPHRALILKSGVWTGGLQNVKITGDWGYFANGSLPEDLAFAATVLVGGIITAQNPNAQNKKMERIGNYQVAYSDDKGLADYNRALSIIDRYKKHVI